MTKKPVLPILLLAAAIFSLSACKKTDDPGSTAQVRMHLTDDPAIYDHVYIDILQVEVTISGSSAVLIAPVRAGIYDVLQFRNGLDTLLATATLPAGTIGQIRLILGNNNSVVADGISYPLTTPSAQESGVKLNLHETLAAGGSYDIWIDFDAGKSIVQTGNGSFKLKPVIKAYSSLTVGRIKGFLLPLNAKATVYAVNGTDTSSAIPGTADGFFMINALAEGTYQLWINPGIPLLQPYVQSNVSVVYGVETNVGSIVLHP